MKNQKGFTIVELLIVLVIIGIIFALAFNVWKKGEEDNLRSCKDKYGSSYTLGHSSTNSSIEWCVSSDGVLKEL